jgi:glycosyltransferase involved in cell wall biosynthesis
MKLSVILPTHQPHSGRLERTLTGLQQQTLDPTLWELIIIDNASQPPLTLPTAPSALNFPCRCVRENQIGLSWARQRGLREAQGDIIVFVDDDNVLEPHYLEHVLHLFQEHSKIAAIGGKSLPEFEVPPEPWQKEFLPLLALRDGGEHPIISQGLKTMDSPLNHYPVAAAPIGAGMALRLSAGLQWAEDSKFTTLSDRCGTNLSSGGDNDIIFSVMKQGWEVAYFPELILTHLIPPERLAPDYLARLNRGIQKSWMQMLIQHKASDWPTIPAWTLPLRKIKAWFTHHAWTSKAAHIRWQGACGHFEGRILPT